MSYVIIDKNGRDFIKSTDQITDSYRSILTLIYVVKEKENFIDVSARIVNKISLLNYCTLNIQNIKSDIFRVICYHPGN